MEIPSFLEVGFTVKRSSTIMGKGGGRARDLGKKSIF